jgi:4-amino-4-deoxy-L-arabinose transferase-like glycosyltransferase
MMKSSYSDIVRITSTDVHPPLYYWGLKAFSSLFGSSAFALRLFSQLGVLAVLLLGCFPIRRFFGDKVALPFILLMIIFPVTQYLVTDIRMYSWAMFFVLACALSAYDVYRKNKVCSWLLFFFTGICAAYLHNYGLMSVLGIYILLLAALIRGKKKWRYLIFCGILFSIAYLPWAVQLMSQLRDVEADYWIKPLTINDLCLHIYYFYSPKSIWLPFTYFTKYQMMVWLILIMFIQLILTLKVLITGFKEKDKIICPVVFSFLAFLFPVLLGGVISLTSVPILVTRYMTCSFGLFVLGIAFILAKATEYPIYRTLSYAFVFLLLITGGVRAYSGVKHYNEIDTAYGQIREFVTKDKEQPVFVVNSFSYQEMPRVQLIVPNCEYYVLDRDKSTNFEPFVFERIDSIPFHDFILLQHDRKDEQREFRLYQAELLKEYSITDSLRILDICFYKVSK